ncbi:uncharacterized protein LOC132282028 [Cornus florida]|uniref:uncharacterized protein LOC132282028 n=1 Tax=Cornus florida TaxID=4283 RepID=UPI0028987102|nr:uncharacterized protein LOC132282028 [Cornus florida]
MLQLRHIARLLIKHSIGNGANTSFWWDNWAPGGPLCSRFPLNLLIEGGFIEGITVENFIVNNNWAFPITLTNAIPELLNLLAPCIFRRDTKKWMASPTGLYSFNHTIAHLTGDLPTAPWHNLVWHSLTIARMKFNHWLVAQSRLPPLDRKSMANHNNICSLCSMSTESHDHLFFNCSFISPLCRFIKYKCNSHIAIKNWETLVLWASNQWKANNPTNLHRKLGLSTLVYHYIIPGKRGMPEYSEVRRLHRRLYVLRSPPPLLQF